MLSAVVCFALTKDISSAQNVQVKIPITLRDNNSHSVTIYFGIDPDASYCIDPALGELELPSDNCGTSDVCEYFIDSREEQSACLGNGILLNYHQVFSPLQSDTFRVVFTAQNYPITFHWPDNLHSYFDGATLADIGGGSIVNADMLATDSLVIMSPVVSQLNVLTQHPKGFIVQVDERMVGIPKAILLYQNYPNPCNPSTSIAFDLSSASIVTLRIFDTIGNPVATLLGGIREEGHHVVQWSPDNLPSGIYFYQLTAAGSTTTKMLSIIR